MAALRAGILCGPAPTAVSSAPQQLLKSEPDILREAGPHRWEAEPWGVRQNQRLRVQMSVRGGRASETATKKPKRACIWSKANEMRDDALVQAGRGYGISKLGSRGLSLIPLQEPASSHHYYRLLPPFLSDCPMPKCHINISLNPCATSAGHHNREGPSNFASGRS